MPRSALTQIKETLRHPGKGAVASPAIGDSEMKPQAPTARHMLLASAAMALAFMAGAATAEEKPKEHADTASADASNEGGV